MVVRAPAAESAVELGRPGAALRGVAGDGTLVVTAIALPADLTNAGASAGAGASAVTGTGPTGFGASLIEARGSATWTTTLDGVAGPVAMAGEVIVAMGGSGSVAGILMRGQPGAALLALDGATGAIRWKLAVDATEWAVIAAVSATPDGIAIAGSFAGTLRIADSVVASAGRTDGFVARLALDGTLQWLVRIGGEGADGIAGVALATDRVAIAGTFAAGADVLGEALESIDARSLLADAFVAELDRAGHRVWAKAFGSAADDHVAGVAIDARGRVVVAAIVREAMRIDGAEYVARGAADGLVAWFSPTGETGPALLLGGADFDGLRAICAVGERVVVGGFFSGALALGDRRLIAGGGDDAFLASLADGRVVESWPITGEGREEIVALSAIPGGFVVGISHTASATIGSATLASPADPLGGFGVVVRGVN